MILAIATDPTSATAIFFSILNRITIKKNKKLRKRHNTLLLDGRGDFFSLLCPRRNERIDSAS